MRRQFINSAFNVAVPANTQVLWFAHIIKGNFSFSLRRLLVNMYWAHALNLNLMSETQTTQFWTISLQPLPLTSSYGQVFDNISAALAVNDNIMRISKCGQYEFEGMSPVHDLRLALHNRNMDLIEDYTWHVSITAEIERHE